MIVSMAMAVLPVWRSPMISSRWPRPIGIRASIALMPVWAGVRVDHATDERRPDGDFDHATGRLDRVAFLDVGRVAEDDRADGLLSQVEGHAHDSAREFEKLGRERVRQAVDLGDPVADLDHGADAARLGALIEVLDRVLDDADDLV
jgi:hypothetical protein